MRIVPIDALGESTESPPRREIEAYAGIAIGETARDVRARLDRVLTKRTIFVRFSTSPEDCDPLLRDSAFRAARWTETMPDLLTASPRPAWFRPEEARRFVAAEVERAAILVDVSSESSRTVYVVARS